MHVVAGRKKESMKTESTALAGQKETTYLGEKENGDTDLEFSSWFSVVFQTWCAKTPFGAYPQIEARKLLPPHNFIDGVQLFVFTSLRLTVNSL